jgi:hypothetical protein
LKRDGLLRTEITAYLDYAEVESLKGLRALPWERAPEEAEEVDDTEEWEEEHSEEGSLDETLVQLTNCIREDVLQGDLRAFYLTWKKLGDRGSRQAPPEPLPGSKKLPVYLKGVSRMLKSSAER